VVKSGVYDFVTFALRYHMTFRHSLSISVAVHFVIFGSALAIAQHAGTWLLSSRDVIMVALVPGGGQTGGAGRGVVQQHRQAAPALEREPESRKGEALTEVTSATEKVPAPSSSVVDDRGQGRKDVTESPLPVSGSGQGLTTEPGGGGMPGEWALLAAAIDRAKQYPRLARERGIEGIVWLRVKLASSGTVEKIEIAESSGSEILDKAAIETVYRATAAASVPAAFHDWIKFPMRYVLK
jgi:TonB family protein